MSERLSDALPVYLAVVIGLAFMLLMIVFRSILVPLTATLGFLLSVLATLGATVAVFQEGAFGLMEGQPIVSFMPIFLIGVVFGLAMDYQVFLVTRIREAHVHGATTREAVVDGFRNSARVVAAAAVIMTSVFAAFMLHDEPIIKSMGFALAVAVLFDAFVVRMTLIPALMYLLGEKAWWLPALARPAAARRGRRGREAASARTCRRSGPASRWPSAPDAEVVEQVLREPVAHRRHHALHGGGDRGRRDPGQRQVRAHLEARCAAACRRRLGEVVPAVDAGALGRRRRAARGRTRCARGR